MNADHPTHHMTRPQPEGAATGSWTQGPLTWGRTHWAASEWELRAGDRPIGALTVRGTFRERTLGRGPSGDYEIRGRWTGAAEIARVGGGLAVASYQPGWWGGGVITTASGVRYEWTHAGFWKPEHIIATESGFACVRFRMCSWRSSSPWAVTIEPAGMRIPELEALVLMCWRLLTASTGHAY